MLFSGQLLLFLNSKDLNEKITDSFDVLFKESTANTDVELFIAKIIKQPQGH